MPSTLTLGQLDTVNMYRITMVLIKLGFQFNISDELYEILVSSASYMIIPDLQ